MIPSLFKVRTSTLYRRLCSRGFVNLVGTWPLRP